jgi:integrase
MLGGLPPGDHGDPAVKGLQLRVRQGRDGSTSRTWLFRYAWRGEGVRISIGHLPTMTLADARVRALELRGALDEGIDPRRARPRRRGAPAPLPLSSELAPGDRHSIEYLVSEYSTRYLREQHKRPEIAEYMLKRDVLPAWKGRDARSIKPLDVIELLDGIVDRGAPVLANRTAAVLSQLFRFGVQRRIVEASPVQLLMRPGGREKPRSRVLSDDELRAILADAPARLDNSPLAHVVTLLLLTGQRRGELARARWRDVDFDACTWTIPASVAKNGRQHIVPLSAWALTELEAFKRRSRGSLWVLPAADPTKPVRAKLLSDWIRAALPALKRHHVGAFTLHDLRRTCRTGLSRLKVAPHVAERVLNHVQKGVAGVYDVHEYLDEKREALDKWAAHLEALKAMGPPKTRDTD